MKNLVYLLVLISFSITSPCMAASRSRQQVVITSEPAGADVFIRGQYQGITPRAFSLQRNRSHRIIFQKNGYEPQYIDLRSRTSNARMSNKNLVSGLWRPPVVGAGLGAVYGLAVVYPYVTAGSPALIALSLTGIGAALGSVVSLAALGTRMHGGSKKKQFPKRVHFTLQKDGTDSRQ